jgi:tRNA A37 threonylcarbamoyladenosine biosynthesis protein TsaE
LNDPREVDELGLDELGSGAVLAIEWADKLHHSPGKAIVVHIEHAGDTERIVTVDSSSWDDGE